MRNFMKTMLAIASLGIFMTGGSLDGAKCAREKHSPCSRSFCRRLKLVKSHSLLQSKSFRVKAVGIPLTSFADDVAAPSALLPLKTGR